MSAFDLDAFLHECLRARGEAEPHVAIKDVLERAVSDASGVAAALPPEKAEIVKLHVSPELTVLKVVWTPGMSFRPHDHATWAAIGIYTGGEDNTFFRQQEGQLVRSGGTELRPGDAAVLGHATIHSVTNPTVQHAGAIHVYGADLFAQDRSEWDPDTHERRRYEPEFAFRYFEEQNARFGPSEN